MQEFLNVFKMTGLEPILGKRASQKKEVRKRLMNEGLALFSSHGLEKTTVSDIVENTKINNSIIFKSVELNNSDLENSIIGSNSKFEGSGSEIFLGDNSKSINNEV